MKADPSVRFFFLFISFLVYAVLTKYLVEFDFTHFGAYRIQPGTWAVDWRGIVYLLSSAFVSAFLLNLLFIIFSQPISKVQLILGGLLCDIFFFIHQAIELDLGSAINTIQFRPLHSALVNLVIFSSPLASYFVATGMAYLYSRVTPQK